MVTRSQAIYKSLPSGTQPAYFQLVHHPIQASSIVQNLYYTAGQHLKITLYTRSSSFLLLLGIGRNNLYASQARLSTNALADEAVK